MRFLYGFLKLQGRGYGILIGFSSLLLYTNCKRLREFEEMEISSKVVFYSFLFYSILDWVEVTVNNKEENS